MQNDRLLSRPDFSKYETIVVKIGSSLVTNDGQGINQAGLQAWSKQIDWLAQQGKSVILVTSGAVAEGMKRLNWSHRPKMLCELQAAAAVGQMGLVQAYEACFNQFDRKTAQILLTHDDLGDRMRYLNAQSTIKTLLAYQVIPIINENDTVVTDEITVGDNDTLAALVANLVSADALVILTDQLGLFTADPRKDPTATLIDLDCASDGRLDQMATGAGTQYGKGGMMTKVLAARRAARSGANTYIISGRETDILERLYQGENMGTCLIADQFRLKARKNWIADQLQLAGKLFLDEGASDAIRYGKKSLLPIGVTHLEGCFSRGAMVACISHTGETIAHGLVNYSAEDAQKILRKTSVDIESILGYVNEPELIHRDNLVVTGNDIH